MIEKGTLPEGWRWVRFGDVVRQVKQTTKDPESEGLTRIVGLEHLESESLPLLRWHELDDLPDGTSFTRIFRAGQVLFGKRRAYQRKVAVADFDGVCSGDILVFEPLGDELLAEFLPYVVQSDGFFDHALGTSAGSLSPRTKWQELAKYEFPLPTHEQQRRRVEVLQATDRVRETESAASTQWEFVAAALVAEVLDTHVPERDLAGCCRLPISYGIVQPGTPVSGGIPFVNVEDMTAGPLDRCRLPTTTEEISSKHRRTVLDAGDVLVALRGPIGMTAIVGEDLAGANLSRGVARLAPKPDIHSGYIAACLSTPFVSRQIDRTSTGSTFKELKISALRSLRIPVPDLPVQEKIAAKIEAARRVGITAAASADQAQLLKRQLLTELTETTRDV